MITELLDEIEAELTTIINNTKVTDKFDTGKITGLVIALDIIDIFRNRADV